MVENNNPFGSYRWASNDVYADVSQVRAYRGIIHCIKQMQPEAFMAIPFKVQQACTRLQEWKEFLDDMCDNKHNAQGHVNVLRVEITVKRRHDLLHTWHIDRCSHTYNTYNRCMDVHDNCRIHCCHCSFYRHMQ